MANALRQTLQLQAFKPDLLISAGTAGGFKAQGGAIGNVYISKAVMHHDRRIPIPVGAHPENPHLCTHQY
jgi:5'-methylthioadenosine nucleosidase